MILTVTLNPSVDISYKLNQLEIDNVNRTSSVSKTAGGKGLNVTRVLFQANSPVIATGFKGGYLGAFIEDELNASQIKNSFYPIKEETRNCIAVLHEGNQTEILESGPYISTDELQGFIKHFEELMDEVQLVVFSGSLPAGVPVNYYSDLIKICNHKSIPVIADTSGIALTTLLERSNKPFAIKPNLDELSQILGYTVSEDITEMKNALKHEMFNGIQWIFVSLGANGSLVKHADEYYKVNIPKIRVVNPVGSGDATVAGFATAYSKDKSVIEIIKTANTFGMLNAMEQQTGCINIDKFEGLYKQIKIIEV